MPKNRLARRPAIASMTLVAGVVGAIALPPAHADDSAPSDGAKPTQPAARSDQIQTVTVTAQKRKEDASKVPISMSVLGGEELQAQHITDITDVTRAVPNVSFSGQGLGGAGPGLSNIEMRGVASSAGSNTTGIYLDDVSMTTRNIFSLGAAEPKFFDLERIEVLRGPQGTLYGAGSMGGTVKFISNQPDLRQTSTDLTSEISSTKGGGANYQLTAVHNSPLIPGQLAVRIGVLQGRTSGYIDQVDSSGHQVASNINWERDSVLRLGVKWKPTPQLSITPSLFYQDVHTGDIDASYLNLAPNKTSKTVREPGVDKLTVPSVTVGYDLGGADLTSVSSYFQRIFNRTQDGTAVNSEYIGSVLNSLPDSPPGLGDAVGVLPSAIFLNNRVFQFSQELRLASKDYEPGQSPVTWIVGTYLSNLRTALYDNEPVFGINDAFTSFGADPADPNLLGYATPNDMVYQSLRRYKTTQSALFGEAIYHFTPSFYGTVGARYIKSKDSLDQDLNYYFADGPQHIQRGASGNAFTPKFALTWDINPNETVYANAAKGARLGSENRFIPTGVCGQDLKNQGLTNGVPASYGPDSLWSYELGSKSKLLDNRLNVNLAAFYIDWKKLQQDVQLPICGFDYETNIGGARSVGFEFEVKGKPNANLTLGLSGGYTNAQVTSDVAVLNVKSGDPVAGVPRYNATATVDYSFDITSNVAGFVRGSSSWVGASHGSLVKTDPDYARPGYSTVNLSAGANYNTLEVSIFAKNVFNDQKVIQRPNVEFVNEGYRLRPRTIGISLSDSL